MSVVKESTSDIKISQIWHALNQNATFGETYKNLNVHYGGALKQMIEPDRQVLGRDRELKQLHEIMEKISSPVAMIVGEAGSGKSALVRAFSQRINSDPKNKFGTYFLPISLSLTAIGALGLTKGQRVLGTFLHDLKRLEVLAQNVLAKVLPNRHVAVLVFMDEFHKITNMFGAGTTVGGNSIKEDIERPPIRVIAATTRGEYDDYILPDEALVRRFDNIFLQELKRDIVMNVCMRWWRESCSKLFTTKLKTLSEEKKRQIYNFKKSDLEYIIEVGKELRSTEAEPAKSLTMMDNLIGRVVTTRNPVSRRDIIDILTTKRGYDLDADIDIDALEKGLKAQIKGQDLAVEQVVGMFKRIKIQNSHKKTSRLRGVGLLTGSTGVGKTETLRVCSTVLYGDAKKLLFLAGQNYIDEDALDRLMYDLGSWITHNGSGIIVIDEIEKADKRVRDYLMGVTDDGMIQYFIKDPGTGRLKTKSVSARNCFLFITTNEGHEVYKNESMYADTNASEAVQIAKRKDLVKQIRSHLINAGWRPEFLGRFDAIVIYRPLTKQALVDITQKFLVSKLQDFYRFNGVKVYLNKPQYYPYQKVHGVDVCVFIASVKAKSDDSNSGGARRIRNELEDNVIDVLIDEIYKKPEVKEFKLSVSKNTSLYHAGATTTDGGVIVSEIIKK